MVSVRVYTLVITLHSLPKSNCSPSREIPCPNSISKVHCLNGGASLFLATLTLTAFPTTSSPFFIEPVRRISSLTVE